MANGSGSDMSYVEYSQRRKDLKNKGRKEAGKALTNLILPTGAGKDGKIVRKQIEELDKKYEGEEHNERLLRGDVPSPPSMGYRLHYWFWQLAILVLVGWWTLGIANWVYHRHYRKKWPKDLRV